MFDEPSSYLDVKQRINAARTIRGLLTADVCVRDDGGAEAEAQSAAS